MEKAEKIFGYLLKDFASNPDYKENWEDLGDGRKALKRYPCKLPPQLQISHPFIVYIAFVTLKTFPFLGRFEKIAWEIPILYKNKPFLLAHRKFGFDISINKEDEEMYALGIEAISMIHKAIPFVETLANPLIRNTVNEGKITIESSYTKIRNRYVYYREKIAEEHNSDKEKLKTKAQNFGPGKFANIDETMEAYREIQRLQSVNYYHLLSMIDAYFSLLEHVSVLLLPFIKGIKIKEIKIEEFMGGTWKSKLKIVLKTNTNKEALKFIEILDEIKEQIRNPASHGHFQKKGQSFYVHMKGIGAIPFTLTQSKTNFKYGFSSKTAISYSDICKHFDNFDSYLNTSETKFGMQYIQNDLPVAYDPKSVAEYRRRMRTDKSASNYIEETTREMENAINMDW